jgi:hypothetical protein
LSAWKPPVAKAHVMRYLLSVGSGSILSMQTH